MSRRIFDKYHAENTRQQRSEVTSLVTRLLPLEEFSKNDIIVDLGCGQGEFVHELNRKEVTARGYDIVKSYKKNVFYANLSKGIPEEDGAATALYAGGIINYVESPMFFIREMHRVLATRGKVALSKPNMKSLVNRVSCFIFGRPAIPITRDPNVNEIFLYEHQFLKLISNHFVLRKRIYNRGIIPILRVKWPFGGQLFGDTTAYLLEKIENESKKPESSKV